MLDKKSNFALGISKIDEEVMCEFQFARSLFIKVSKKMLSLSNPLGVLSIFFRRVIVQIKPNFSNGNYKKKVSSL